MNAALGPAASARPPERMSLWEHVKNDSRTLAFLFLLPTMVVDDEISVRMTTGAST